MHPGMYKHRLSASQADDDEDQDTDVIGKGDKDEDDEDEDESGKDESDDVEDDKLDKDVDKDDGAEKADKKTGEEHDPDEEDDLGLSDAEIERKEKRRQAKREKRERLRESRNADKRLIASLQEQLSQVSSKVANLDKKGSAAELGQLEAAIDQHRNAFHAAEAKMKQTMGKDPDAFLAALNARDEIRDRFNTLVSHKNRLTTLETKAGRPTVDPTVIKHARQFASDHSWYDPQGRDEDSKIVMAIDETLVNEGFVPHTDQYWKELRTRTKRRLPHKFEAADRNKASGKRVQGKPGSMGGGVKRDSVQGSKGVTLSKERREAMQQAGLKPGTKGWAEMAASYQKYDKANRSK